MTRSIPFPALALSAGLVLSGCATAPEEGESAVSTIGDPKVITGLAPIGRNYDAPFLAMPQAKEGARAITIPGLFGGVPLAEPFARHQALEERRIAQACSVPDVEGQPFVSTTSEPKAGAGGFVQSQFEKYAVAYAVQAIYPFYRRGDGQSAGFTPELAARCLRIVRYDARSSEIRLDAIVQLRLDSFTVNASSYRDALQIRPLRVYFRKGSYQENEYGHKVSLSASLAVDATWFEHNKGQSGTVLNFVVLPAQEFEAKEDGDPFRYYGWSKDAGDFSQDWSQVPRLPLPPFSTGLAAAQAPAGAQPPNSWKGAPPVIFRVAAAEAGPVPASLKLVAGIVNPAADITGVLTNAVKRTLGIPGGL